MRIASHFICEFQFTWRVSEAASATWFGARRLVIIPLSLDLSPPPLIIVTPLRSILPSTSRFNTGDWDNSPLYPITEIIAPGNLFRPSTRTHSSPLDNNRIRRKYGSHSVLLPGVHVLHAANWKWSLFRHDVVSFSFQQQNLEPPVIACLNLDYDKAECSAWIDRKITQGVQGVVIQHWFFFFRREWPPIKTTPLFPFHSITFFPPVNSPSKVLIPLSWLNHRSRKLVSTG